MFFFSLLILHPFDSLSVLRCRNKKDKWQLLRILMGTAAIVGLCFWAASIKPSTSEGGEYAVERDKLVQLTGPINAYLRANLDIVPFIATFFLCVMYMLLLSLIVRYVLEDNYMLPDILTSWLIALSLTIVTSEPLSKTSIHYYDTLYYPLEFVASDTVVSWHMLVLLISVRHLINRFKTVLMTVFMVITCFLQALFLLSVRVTYTPAIIFAVLISAFSASVRTFIISKLESLRPSNGTISERLDLIRKANKSSETKFTIDERSQEEIELELPLGDGMSDM